MLKEKEIIDAYFENFNSDVFGAHLEKAVEMKFKPIDLLETLSIIACLDEKQIDVISESIAESYYNFVYTEGLENSSIHPFAFIFEAGMEDVGKDVGKAAGRALAKNVSAGEVAGRVAGATVNTGSKLKNMASNFFTKLKDKSKELLKSGWNKIKGIGPAAKNWKEQQIADFIKAYKEVRAQGKSPEEAIKQASKGQIEATPEVIGALEKTEQSGGEQQQTSSSGEESQKTDPKKPINRQGFAKIFDYIKDNKQELAKVANNVPELKNLMRKIGSGISPERQKRIAPYIYGLISYFAKG